MSSWWRVGVVLLAAAVLAAACSSSGDDGESVEGDDVESETAAEAGVDIYSFAGGCHVLSDAGASAAVRAENDGWMTDAETTAATPFRLQATALGSYLFYGPEGEMIAVDVEGAVMSTDDPGPAADWIVTADGESVALTNVESNLGLAVDADGRLTQTDAEDDATRWSLDAAEGCADFPDIDPGTTGEPLTGDEADGAVVGFFDSHTHISGFRFLGGNFHCGRPWSPYGVTVALVDCADHADGGTGARTEALVSDGSLAGTHDNHGWPTFEGWPKPNSLTHEGTYWRWIERAWRGGLRLMVNHVVENRALCEIYPGGTDDCNEMNSAAQQVADMHDLVDYIDAQFGGPGEGFLRIVDTPGDARSVINSGKLAMVLGVEVSEVVDCGRDGEIALCDEAQIDAGLDELHELGIRTVFPVHKFDNALGGTAYDGGTTGLLVNAGNHYISGDWWAPEPCADGAVPDNTVTSPAGVFEAVAGPISELFDVNVDDMIADNPPNYGEGPHCNPQGLTDLGRYAINGLADREMIIETDHLSALGRQEALDILADRGYSGVISSHSWGDDVTQVQIQEMGGFIGPYAGSLPGFVDTWREVKATAPDEFLFGIGFGTDTNGLGPQPSVRADNDGDPVVYPYTTFDGGTVMEKSVSGTKTFDVNVDGVAHYGMFPDWIEDMRGLAGDEIVNDLAQGAEAYLQMWERAISSE